MKKKNILIICGIIVLIIIICILLLVIRNNGNKPVIKPNYNKAFIYLSNNALDEISIPTIITSYKQYRSLFDNDKLSEDDFTNNNYVLIPINVNSCSEESVTPTDYKISNDTITVEFSYIAKCGFCASFYDYYLLKVDKDIVDHEIKVNYKALNNPHCDPNVSYKPLIYIYPTTDTKVSIKLGKEELLTTTYPKYNNGWEIYAKPDGTLIDKTGRSYYGLYWEGNNYINNNYKDGFVIKGTESIQFLEEKLSTLGLNEKEANEFIMYWLPKLEENKYNVIRFLSTDEINEQMPLKINPTPETFIRVFMIYKPLDKKITINEQKLTKVERNGYTVIEWGGSLIK